MSYIKDEIALEELIEADGKYNYVFAVDDAFGPYYDVTKSIPGFQRSLTDLHANMRQLPALICCEYLLDCIDRMRPNLQNLENTIRQKVHDPFGLQQALSPLYDPLDFQIQDHCHQYDFVSWLYGKLVEADKSKAEYISFSIDQVYYFHY